MKPKLIPVEKAPTYLGIDKKRFKQNIEPYLPKIILREKDIFFDHVELDNIFLTLRGNLNK